jgi:hypothetical protein
LKGLVIHIRLKDSTDKITVLIKDHQDDKIIILNNQFLAFGNSKSGSWFDFNGKHKNIDPFFFKNLTTLEENDLFNKIRKIQPHQII